MALAHGVLMRVMIITPAPLDHWSGEVINRRQDDIKKAAGSRAFFIDP
jgi:hypothetical protein